jgi:adenylate cyclase
MASRRRALLLLAAVLAAGLGVLAQATGALRWLELETIDARFAVRSDETTPPDVVVLGMDPDTFERLGVVPPFPRKLHARASDALREAGARTIAYDIEFVGFKPGTEPMLRAFRRAGNVVLATLKFVRGGGSSVLGSPATIRAIRARVGFAGYAADKGDVIRRVRGHVEGAPTFAALAAGRSTGEAWIDYRGDVPIIPFWKAIEGRLPPLAGKVVVVGDVDPAGHDVHATPLGTRSGPEIQAVAIGTLQRGAPLRDLASGWGYALIVLLGVAVPLAALVLHGLRWLPVAALELVAWTVAAQLLFDGGRIAPFVPGLVAALAGSLGTLLVTYATELRTRRRLREHFARFAPPDVVDALVDRADGSALPGERVEATVLFADLRGFTATAERIGAERVIELLNGYLATMSDAILDHGGTVVSFMGDGIMAVFGAPVPLHDHADRALAAAREMLGPRLDAFNNGLDEPLRMGVGLASGPVMSGTVGSARRVEYAAVGDTTNTASRLEALTKETGHDLHVAATTRAALRTAPADLVEAGELELRGKAGRVEVWTLAGGGGPLPGGFA